MSHDFKVPESIEDVLDVYTTAVLHLRQQFKFKRIGVTLGAGVSVPLKYPSWDDLVREISTDGAFQRDILSVFPDSSIITTTQRLYEYYHSCTPKQPNETERVYSERVANSWKKLLSESLYRENRGEEKIRNINSHPYLIDLLPIISISNLGSGLIDQSQKMTVAAMQMAEKKV